MFCASQNDRAAPYAPADRLSSYTSKKSRSLHPGIMDPDPPLPVSAVRSNGFISCAPSESNLSSTESNTARYSGGSTRSSTLIGGGSTICFAHGSSQGMNIIMHHLPYHVGAIFRGRRDLEPGQVKHIDPVLKNVRKSSSIVAPHLYNG